MRNVFDLNGKGLLFLILTLAKERKGGVLGILSKNLVLLIICSLAKKNKSHPKILYISHLIMN
jgi:hypothetical protein